MACGVWSFCHEVEKMYGEHCSPAIWCGPAFDVIRKVLASTADFIEASSTFDQMYPTMKSTLSDSINLSVFCLPTSGLKVSSSYTTSTGRPPILRPM